MALTNFPYASIKKAYLLKNHAPVTVQLTGGTVTITTPVTNNGADEVIVLETGK